jgi:hypothetical protein
MRGILSTTAACLLIVAPTVYALGCSTEATDCERTLECAQFLAGAAGSTSNSTTSTGSGGASPDCTGDPNTENVVEACGVFVQADAGGSVEDGTEAQPYKTLQKAIDNSGTKRVYACASAPYTESVTVADPVEIYGGFECAKAWTWTAAGRSALNGAAGAVALTLTKQADGTKVQGFAITSAAATKKSDSSVAVAVDAIVAALISCEVTAGDGMAGEDGAPPSGIATKGNDAMPPDAATMNACISPGGLSGGAPGTLTCNDGVTAGGLGGKGGITGTMNGDGAPGVDGMPTDSMKGKGGAGEDALNDCADGIKGKSGVAGSAGDAGSLPGALSLSGIADVNVTDGKPGGRGNGGGGGGGAKSGLFCAAASDGNGASGGGGGAGGCGGKGGGGGKAGGSSIAIVSLGTNLKLIDVTLTTGKGGAGGKGVGGQSGGAVGLGAIGGAASGNAPSKAGCKGGDGGAGGAGGPGGGGRGGHSVGIAYASAPTTAPIVKGFMGDTEGPGGTAGPGNATGNGASGAKGACWDFGKNAACAQ